jgi:crotonobetainyl-CoA:carnitine CoA-transferase CaiB-like acyl-CoA transferase
VLAGPVATRFLAGLGADVLRIDPPGWDEGAVVPEVTLGKRCAGLDLKSAEDRRVFEELVRQSDVLVHGYRPNALGNLGYDSESLQRLNPRLIAVSLDAYGWSGPWAGRRGFDSLVQMSTGIADYGMKMRGAGKPVALPVQALDHATGYLVAASVLHALYLRSVSGEIYFAKMSLARTAHLLCKSKRLELHDKFRPEEKSDIDPRVEATTWGPALRVKFPLQINGINFKWPCPAGPYRSSPAVWS